MQDFIHAVSWLRTHSIIPMMIVFVLIAVTTYWPGRRKTIERNGMIPLQDER